MGSRPKKYIYRKAKWNKFKERTQEMVHNVFRGDLDGWNRSICDILIKADEFIPRVELSKERQIVPSWTEACILAVRDRNKAYRRLRKHPIEAHIVYKKLRAKARKVIKEAKRDSWRKFCSALGIRNKC